MLHADKHPPTDRLGVFNLFHVKSAPAVASYYGTKQNLQVLVHPRQEELSVDGGAIPKDVHLFQGEHALRGPRRGSDVKFGDVTIDSTVNQHRNKRRQATEFSLIMYIAGDRTSSDATNRFILIINVTTTTRKRERNEQLPCA